MTLGIFLHETHTGELFLEVGGGGTALPLFLHSSFCEWIFASANHKALSKHKILNFILFDNLLK